MTQVCFEDFLCVNEQMMNESLENQGLFTFEAKNQEEVKRLAFQLGDIYNHPDSEDGITYIKARKVTHQNNIAFTKGSLDFHTDRSSEKIPPDLLIFFCLQPAQYGGESLLSDGKQIYNHLESTNPMLLSQLFKPNSALFGIEKYSTSVFEKIESHRLRLRFRSDHLGHFNYSSFSAITEMNKLIEHYSFSFKLQKGQGYVIKNDRMLHGRTDFGGTREMIRILVHSNQLGFSS